MSDNIFDKEIAFGLMPFETIYFQNNKLHNIEEHYLRIKRACKIFEIKFEYSIVEFKTELYTYIKGSTEKNCAIKVVILNNKMHMNIRKPSYNMDKYKVGFRLRVSKTIRDNKNILTYFKTFNYGVNYIEDMRAKGSNYDGALFLNMEGIICETSYANIFFRSKRVLYTPKLESGILNGIMKKKVIQEARHMGYEVKKVFINSRELLGLEECFITNSVIGVFPVKSIDEYSFSNRDFALQLNEKEGFIRPWNE